MTDKQRRFIDEYLKDQNAAQASVRAGLSYDAADQMMRLPHVKREMKRRMRAISQKADVTAEQVVRELWRVGNSNIAGLFNESGGLKPMSELTEDQQRIISAIDEDELFEGVGRDREQVGVTKKVRLWDKVRALELLAKKFKLLTDKVEVGVSDDLAQAIREARLRRKNAK